MPFFKQTLVLLAMSILNLTGLPSSATAQTSGIEKCSLDGYVMTYYPALDYWQKSTVNRCSTDQSSNRDDDDRPSSDYDRRREDRRSASSADSRAGQLVDGDEKCGPDGYILKYRYSEYRKAGSWSNTFRKCSR